MPTQHQLQVSPAGDGGAMLSPEHKRFNTLIGQIAGARATLGAWQEQIPLYQQAHVKRLEPLMAQLRTARREAVFALDRLLDRPGWSKAEQQTLRDVIVERLEVLIAAAAGEPDPALKALFDKHAGIDFETDRKGARESLKGLFEEMTGTDLGDAEDIESDEALLERMQQAFGAHHAAEAERAAQKAADPQRRKTAAEKRRENEALQATQSVREVYRKLASALHPDRETDAELRAAKTALMQRVNSAYAANDLLALLELQLAIEQIDASHIQGASIARIKQYNKLLAAQLAELKAEAERVQIKFEMDFGLDVDRKLNPGKLGRLIDQGYQELSALLAEERRESRILTDRISTRQWLKMVRRQMRQADSDLDFF